MLQTHTQVGKLNLNFILFQFCVPKMDIWFSIYFVFSPYPSTGSDPVKMSRLWWAMVQAAAQTSLQRGSIGCHVNQMFASMFIVLFLVTSPRIVARWV